MARKFQNLRDKMTPAQRARASAMSRALLDEMPMHVLRRARQISQEELAALLDIKQSSVSKLERRTDLYISTLRRYIEAMGGSLELRANFPDGTVNISSLEQIAERPGK